MRDQLDIFNQGLEIHPVASGYIPPLLHC